MRRRSASRSSVALILLTMAALLLGCSPREQLDEQLAANPLLASKGGTPRHAAAADYPLRSGVSVSRALAPGVWIARQPGRLLYASFDAEGVSLSTALTDLRPFGKQSSTLDISAVWLACDERVARIAKSRPERRSDFEVEYTDAKVGLWQSYVNEAQGLRQKLRLTKMSKCAASTSLRVVLALEDGVVRASEARAVLRAPGGRRLLYDSLVARDAEGRSLPVRFGSAGRGLFIEVQAADATAPLEVSALVWSEQQLLTSTEDATDVSFGQAVAIDGDTAVVAAPGRDAVQVFARSGRSWLAGPVLTRSDSSSGGAFGSNIAVSGDVLAVAAPGGNAGVSVFERSGGEWTERTPPLTGSGQKPGDNFGSAMALDGDWLLVGAALDDSQEVGSGAVYAFEREDGAWTERPKLLEEGAFPKSNRNFGRTMAISGRRAAIVAKSVGPGTVNVLDQVGDGWSQTARFDGAELGAAPNFGISVAVHGDLLVVGADDETVGEASNAGAVYTFDLSGRSPPQKVVAAAPVVDLRFGISVAAGVQAWFATALAADIGSAYFFTQAPSGWTQAHVFAPAEPLLADGYGSALSASGNAVIVGAPTYLFQPGRAVIYALDDGAPCSRDSDCLHGHCSEGVCCEAACEGGCQSCLGSVTLTGVDGQCAEIPAGAMPKTPCETDPKQPCRADGLCDGKGQCRAAAPTGGACGVARCVGDTLERSRCDGAGRCVPISVDCGEFSCMNGACVTRCTDTAACSEGFFCEDAVCVPRFEDGRDCAAGMECLNGHCVDGVCCESACEGQCEFCADERFVGRCVTLPGAPRGGRPACAGDEQEPCSLASCDGVVGDSCQAMPPPGTTCSQPAHCPSGQRERTTGRCDGAGTCACVPTQRCSEDRASSLAADGRVLEECGSYRCADDSCLLTCTDADDCAPGIPCNPSTSRCEPPSPKTTSGCAFAAPATRTVGGPFGLALFLISLGRSFAKRTRARRPHL